MTGCTLPEIRRLLNSLVYVAHPTLPGICPGQAGADDASTRPGCATTGGVDTHSPEDGRPRAWMPAGPLRQDRKLDVPAVVVAYDPGWPGLFRELRDRAGAALAGVAHVTEHVGSTAVPGLDAKPVIDLDVVVPHDAAADAAIRVLAAAGWQHQGDLGIKGREAFLPPGEQPVKRSCDGSVHPHLHACAALVVEVDRRTIAVTLSDH